MSTVTEKLGLIKLDRNDPADITAINENWDKLDSYIPDLFESDISMGGNRITDVGEPQYRSDVATKGFVEDFSIESSTYVAVDERKDGNVIIRPYIPEEGIVLNEGIDYGTTLPATGTKGQLFFLAV